MANAKQNGGKNNNLQYESDFGWSRNWIRSVLIEPCLNVVKNNL